MIPDELVTVIESCTTFQVNFLTPALPSASLSVSNARPFILVKELGKVTVSRPVFTKALSPIEPLNPSANVTELRLVQP